MDWLQLINYDSDKDTIYSVGDISDRGPGVKECFDFAMKYNFKVVLSNHEEKLLRWAKGNPVKMNPELEDTIKQLGENVHHYVEWIKTLPYYLEVPGGYVIHAAVGPSRPIEEQSKKMLLMGRTYPFSKFEKGQPSTAPPWEDSYKGHLGKLYVGHTPTPSYNHSGNSFVVNLDSGCVFGSLLPWGGNLRGIRFEDGQIFEVPARKESEEHYKSLWGNALVGN